MAALIKSEVRVANNPCCHASLASKFLYELNDMDAHDECDPLTCVALVCKYKDVLELISFFFRRHIIRALMKPPIESEIPVARYKSHRKHDT